MTDVTGESSNTDGSKLKHLKERFASLRHDILDSLKDISEEETYFNSSDIQQLRLKLETVIPQAFEKFYRSELFRLLQLPTSSADYQRIFTHLEFISELPWSEVTAEVTDQECAASQLNSTHFDLASVKEQLLEYVAMAELRPKKRAPVLLFIGPPGMGKLSLALSLGKCLKRPVERFNLAAARGQEYIMGESRTQLNGKPGCIMKALHRYKIANPVIVFEELDRLDWGRADCAGIPLIEVFDSRNEVFIDEYVGIPFDISQIWFIATANSLDGVPKALHSQTEIIEFAGYTDREKIEIAARFLIPKSRTEVGLSTEQIFIENDAIQSMLRRYTRESGVLQLNRCIQKIIRKVVKKVQEGRTAPFRVGAEDLSKYLGPEWFFKDEERNATPVGVASGLVWTDSGGEIISVEAVRLPKGRGLILTGRLGKVMRESAETALSYLWSRSEELSISENEFIHSGTHIHVPAGSIAKDGPSAGVTIFAALASLFLRKSIPADVAMTGEITLTGQVFPVGGVREKVLAAHRAGFKRLILPEKNETDLQLLPDDIRAALQFILVRNVDEVFPLLFHPTNKAKQASKEVKKKDIKQSR